MNLIFNISSNLLKELEDNKKLLFFANNFSEKTKKAEKIYFHYKGKIIGEAKVESFKDIEKSKVGVTSFILFWAEKIEKDKELLERLKKVLSYNIKGYDNYIKLMYLYNEWYLEFFDREGHWFDTLNLSRKELFEFQGKRTQADKIIQEADEWLTDIGYYNRNCESFFKKYLEISNIILYNTSKDLTLFKNKDNQKFIKPIKTWVYTVN